MTDLQKKVTEWISKQGYPLEFATAAIFRKYGFQTRQGHYLPDPATSALREIDVLAWFERVDGETIFDVAAVVECKWSKDKPWVFFVSEQPESTASSQLAYMIGSRFGECHAWCLLRDPNILQVPLFKQRGYLAFGGRQALAEKNDLFYATMQSVIAASVAHARALDPGGRLLNDAKRTVRLVVPIVVVDAPFFACRYDGVNLEVTPAESVRVQWHGSEFRQQPVYIHVVSAAVLDEYVDILSNNLQALLHKYHDVHGALLKALNSRRWSDLPVTPANYPSLTPPDLLVSLCGSGRS